MAVSFPQNPNEGDTFTSGNSKFLFTDGKWVSDTSPNSLVSKSGDTMTGLLTLSGDPVSNNQAATKLYVDTVGAGPTGSIIMWGTSTLPTGYIECNGQSTSSYPGLAALYGANVPDLRGEFVRGFDNGRGVDSGRALLSTQADEFKSHNHGNNPNGTQNVSVGTGQYTVRQQTGNNNRGGVETRPRNVALMYIIKT